MLDLSGRPWNEITGWLSKLSQRLSGLDHQYATVNTKLVGLIMDLDNSLYSLHMDLEVLQRPSRHHKYDEMLKGITFVISNEW